MKIKRLQLTAVISLLMAVVIAKQTMAQTLQVHHASGATTDLVLDTETTVKFLDDCVIFVTPLQSHDFAKDDVFTLTYRYSKFDVNGDNAIDKKDLVSVIDIISFGHGGARKEADVNGDGSANIGDIIDVINAISNGETEYAPYAPTLAGGTIGDAFYIYRNDGQFNAFFRKEVDSIGFSHFDADSVRYKKIASQVVYTPDSIYLIPLTAIDSVAFVQPETIYNPNVKLYHTLKDYIVNVEGMTIDFTPDIPSNIAPHKDDILFFETSDDLFPSGFAGKVREISLGNYYTVACDTAALQDVYEQVVECIEFGAEEENFRPSADGKRRLKGKVTIPISVGGNILGTGASLTGYVTMEVDGKCIKKILPGKKPFIDISLSSTFIIGVEWMSSFGFGINKEFDLIAGHSEIPIGIPGLVGIAKVTPFIELAIKDDLKLSATKTFKAGIGARLQNGNIEIYKYKSEKPFDISAEFSNNIEIYGGIKGELGVGLPGGLAKLAVTLKLGPNFESHVVMAHTDVDNNNEYKRNYDSYISISARGNLSLTAGFYLNAGKYELGKLERTIGSIDMQYDKLRFHRVPDFSDMTYVKGGSLSEGVVGCVVTRNLIVPMIIGLALYDMDDNLVDTYYKGYYCFGDNMQTTFTGLTPGKQYTCYPIVKMDEKDWKAYPSVLVGEEAAISTGEATEVNMGGAIISCKFNGDRISTCGIAYKKSDSEEWTIVEAKEIMAGSFTIELNNLEPETKYKYYGFVTIDGENINGDEKEFTTLPPPTITTLEATEIFAMNATVGGKIDGFDEKYVIEYGVVVEDNGGSKTFYADNISEDGTFTIKLNNLTPDIEYKYYAFFILKGMNETNNGKNMFFKTIYPIETGGFWMESNLALGIYGTAHVSSNYIKEVGFYYYCDGDDEPLYTGCIIRDSYEIDSNEIDLSSFVENLTPGTVYYFYSCLTDSNGKTWNGDTITTQTVKDYGNFCPDDNHPHMIDFGLPSGTKWACCNVGASEPGKYGGYYAWGETEEKDLYEVGTYSHAIYNADNGGYLYTNIGNDISGTEYDVAHVKWGEKWQMPTFDDFMELMEHTRDNQQSYLKDGVWGQIIVSQNDCAMFLPAGGYNGNSEVVEDGFYWLSTRKVFSYDDEYEADHFEFYALDSGKYPIGRFPKTVGLLVRPVYKE